MRTVSCKSCGAPIVWMLTTKGKAMPVDPRGIHEEDLEYVGKSPVFSPESGHISHFATCPDAPEWRRGKP